MSLEHKIDFKVALPPMLGAKPNGTTVVPLAKLASYSLSDDIVD